MTPNRTLLVYMPEGTDEDRHSFCEVLHEKLQSVGAEFLNVTISDANGLAETCADRLMHSGAIDMLSTTNMFSAQPHVQLQLSFNAPELSEQSLALLQGMLNNTVMDFHADSIDTLLDRTSQLTADDWPGFTPLKGDTTINQLWGAAREALSSSETEMIECFEKNTGISIECFTSQRIQQLFTGIDNLRAELGKDVGQFKRDCHDSTQLLTAVANEATKLLGIQLMVDYYELSETVPVGNAELPQTPPARLLTVAHQSDRITPTQAQAQMEWTNLGQSSGVKRHRLSFYESAEDMDAKHGSMTYAIISKGDDSTTKWSVEGTEGRFLDLREAKAAAVTHAIGSLVRDGYVQAPAPEATKEDASASLSM